MSNPIYRMEHPFRALETTEDNLSRAKRWLRWLARTFVDLDTVAEWIPWVEVLDDADPAERERGLALGEEMAKRLDGLWLVGGRISNGMKMAVGVAVEYRKTVFDLTVLGEEPPSDPEVIKAVRDFVESTIADGGFHRLINPHTHPTPPGIVTDPELEPEPEPEPESPAEDDEPTAPGVPPPETPPEEDWFQEVAEDVEPIQRMDGFDNCVIGLVESFGRRPVFCYDRMLVIKTLMKNSQMTEEEAEEFHEFNQAGAYTGEGMPAFLIRKE